MSEQITPNPSVPSQVVAEVKFPQFINNLGIIPTSYKDSMSYYETLAWLCKYLEETVIPTVNQNGSAVQELQSLYNELQDYVIHYFDNLDVQEEINNKLDRMTENGTLTLLIGNYINPLINQQNALIQELDTKIDSVASGSPLVASSTSDMTETDRIYVNTTDGYWYYYNGTDWVQGGIYQAAEDSETLTDLVEDYENYKEKTVEISPNLFDKDLCIVGKFRRGNGVGNTTEERENSSFAYYKLYCNSGETYIISGKNYGVLLCNSQDELVQMKGQSDSAVSNYVVEISGTLTTVTHMYISFRPDDFPINTYMIVKGSTMPSDYISYGYIFNNNYTNTLRTIIEDKTCYISTSGSDENDGSYLTPFKTLGKAIEEGFTNIYVASGIYDESNIIIENKNDIRIECYNGIATFNNGEKITVTEQGNLLECNKSFESSTNWYKYFIANNINATHNSGGGTPQSAIAQNIGLFEINSEYNNSHNLSIANSLSSCEETTGSFYYDGDTIYINPIHYDENTDYYISVENGVTTNDKNGLYFSNIKNLELYNLKTTFTFNSGFYFDNCTNINCENCEVEYSVAYSGFKLNNSSGNFKNCKVERSHVDGFGISGNNYYSNFYNCESQYNLDDGISHHDNTFGEIVGGNYHHNNKGGVSPSHGARVNCYNIISHHNGIGLYCVAQRYLGRNQIINNCVCYSNNTGLRVDGFHVLSYNCKFTNNSTPTVIADNVNTSYTEL